MNRQFPRLEISRSRLRHNMEEVISRCTAQGIQVCGVIKGCSGLPEVGQLFRDCGATQLASSRLEQIIRCRQAGVPGPYMLLRIPMLCELDDVARWCDYSLESERATLDALEEACARQGAVHKAVIMADLGDLREGFWDQDEMLDVCVHVERDLPHVELAGVGVNLGCYGSIQPTPENLGQLVHIARRVEDAIGRKLEIVSGGATSSFTLVHWGTMPEGINHLRIGEGILVSKDLQVDWGIHDMDYLRMDCMTLQADRGGEGQAHPSGGAIVVDCFCNRPTYDEPGHPPPGHCRHWPGRRGRCDDAAAPDAGHDGGRRLVGPLHPGRGGLPPLPPGRRCGGFRRDLPDHAVCQRPGGRGRCIRRLIKIRRIDF